MNRIEDVYCYYTGGGIYVYSARYGDVFLYGTLDQYICCYRLRGEVLYQDEDLCKEFGWTDEMNALIALKGEYVDHVEDFMRDYYICPDEIEYPTWQDILTSLQKPGYYGYGTADIEETLRYWNPDLTKRTDED